MTASKQVIVLFHYVTHVTCYMCKYEQLCGLHPYTPTEHCLDTASLNQDLLIAYAGDTVSYAFVVNNTGNVKLRKLQLTVPELHGSGSLGSITCEDASTSTSWAAGGSVPAGSSLMCTGAYTYQQDDIELGNTSAVVSIAAKNLAEQIQGVLPVIEVPNKPSLSLELVPSCSKPTRAGKGAATLITATAKFVCQPNVPCLVMSS